MGTASSKEARRRRSLKERYGITLEMFENYRTFQDNICEICKKPLGDKWNPCMDHNHTTGKNRALLHRGCNGSLGLFEDPILRKPFEDYLKRWAEPTTTLPPAAIQSYLFCTLCNNYKEDFWLCPEHRSKDA